MVRKRGGKRQATTPVGGTYKDARRNIQGNEDYDDEEEQYTTVIRRRQKSPTNQSGSGSGPNTLNQPDMASTSNSNQPSETRAEEASASASSSRSFADAVARSSTSERRGSNGQRGQTETNETGERRNKNFVSKFVTPPPQGSMRDEIVVEIQKINGARFIGQLGFKEAKYGIFRGCLNLDPTMIHGLRFAYSDFPVIKYKLKDKIDVDALIANELFTYKRQFMVGNQLKTDEVDCKIRGLRAPGQARPADADPSIRWVKVEWAEYSLQKEQMMEWLERYGEKAGELSEDIHPDSDSDDSPIGSGTYSVKMRLTRDIPQLIPMFGRRVRIYYRGVLKLCTKCFGGHSRLHCRNDKVRWIDYVLRFMEENPDIPEKLYGRWWQAVTEEFGQMVSENDDQEGGQTEERTGSNLERQVERRSHEAEADQQRSSQLENSMRSQQQRQHQHKEPERERLSKQEEDDLSDYLEIGLSVDEAREMHRKEIELAEMKQRIRDNKRAANRGGIAASNIRTSERGAIARNARTRVGPWGMPAGRGGLSFN